MLRVGIDIGGSSAKVGLVDDSGRVLRRETVPTGREIAAELLIERLARSVSDVLRGSTAAGIGVAAPGFRRPDGEGVVNVSNLPGIDGFPLRSALETATGLPTVLDNDANAAALGEYRFGAGREASRLLVVTLGTGIGAGMVVDGQLLRICWGGLGDPGHVIVKPGGPRCACGGRGCLEAVAAVPAIVARANELLGPGPVYADLEAVARAARQGESAASQALRAAGGLLGAALVTHTHLLGPDRILLGGGGLDAAGDLLLEPIRQAFDDHVQPFLRRSLRLDRAALGNDAGLVGAAALVPA